MGRLRIRYEVPEGWDIAVADNGQRFFVRPHSSLLFKYKPELKRFIFEEYGDLLITDKVVDFERGVVYLPPSNVKPKVVVDLIFKRDGGFLVLIGARLKEVIR